ncbi:HupE/UreJ family protein [Litorivicinus sp.]|nr:HupE/UreJ family protein [Litorivicinus sp.]
MRLQKILQKLLLLLMIITLGLPVSADIVKPALVEISVLSNARVTIEIRTSIEALLTGINGRYRNTQEAPNTDAYDALRELEASDLRQQFVAFHAELLDGVELIVDGASIPLEIGEITIAPPGYTKVPRASVIHLVGVIPKESISLRWYYPLRFGDQAVRVRQVNEEAGEYHWSGYQWIADDRPSEPFSLTQVFAKPTFWSVSSLYLSAGFLHIVPKGLDHILFILGIFLMSMRLRPLVLQVTMFTIAHSLTLSLGVFGLVHLQPKVVEPLIALSIAYVAFENLASDRLNRFRLPVIFVFGLLHGLGFASILTEFGLPADLYLAALLWFNVGVEFGQVALLIAAYLAITIWFSDPCVYRRSIVLPGSLLIGVLGVYWTVERVMYYYFS